MSEPLTSIVVLGWNQVKYTRLCVESVQRLTTEPYELILVDNGSTDATAEYFRSVEGATVIVNPSNRGFAGGNNQGIAAARGQYVVLLNNDTVVTKGWLGKMIAHAERAPDIGLVSPMTNYVGYEYQRVAPEYELETLQKFAVLHARKNAAAPFSFHEVLSGFCWLVKRAVLDRIGGLDELFPIGGFEDNDFCMRVRRGGFRMLCARDVFVHHFGSKTFEGNGLQRSRVQDEHAALYAEKWGIGVLSGDGRRVILPHRLQAASECANAGDAAGALVHFRAHLERFPEDASTWANAGRCLHACGQLAEARDAFARAHALEPAEPSYAAGLDAMISLGASQSAEVAIS